MASMKLDTALIFGTIDHDSNTYLVRKIVAKVIRHTSMANSSNSHGNAIGLLYTLSSAIRLLCRCSAPFLESVFFAASCIFEEFCLLAACIANFKYRFRTARPAF